MERSLCSEIWHCRDLKKFISFFNNIGIEAEKPT